MNLIIDVGNTRVKVAVFESDTILEMFIFDKTKIISEVKKITKKNTFDSAIISSVASISEKKLQKLKEIVPLLELNHTIKVPFKNLYKTPTTLGVDRIALATAGIMKYSQKNILIIDAGTCITFDFINSKGEYLGGAISLGIKMRLKALHHFTAKLPLVEKQNIDYYIGKNTNESILSGVVNGVTQEIEGIISQYEEKYSNLTVVLTGGDTNFLSKQLKSSIFAHQNFLLEGLNAILTFNKDK